MRTIVAALTALLLAVAVGACAATPSPEKADAVAPKAGEADAGGAGEVDRSCRTDADCTVKNVGNCCGYYPACVNVDSETFPEQVKADCERRGMASVCGFPVIESCRCEEGQCVPADGGADAELR